MNNLICKCEEELKNVYNELEEISLYNQQKVLDAFRVAKVSLSDMAGSTGYGYDDLAKGKLAIIYKNIFHTTGAVCTPFLTCGTHALCSALFGVLRPGDQLLSISGEVYDSLKSSITGKKIGSLLDFNINYNYIDLIDNDFDYDAIKNAIVKSKIKMVYIQRSAGYSTRDTLSLTQIEKVINFVKNINKDILVFVDNCYGTFCEKLEPTDVGADICVGSLNKNAGGGIAPTGGYIVGREDLIQLIEYRIFGVGLGCEVGSYAHGYKEYFQGLFLAPSVVKNALKGSLLIGKVLDCLGIKSTPDTKLKPNDLIRQIKINDREKMIKFIQLVQKCSPIDSFVLPIPSEMPGYDAPIIMASGGFVQGASIELSADGPVKPPYTVYLQGGVTYEQTKILANEILNLYNN